MTRARKIKKEDIEFADDMCIHDVLSPDQVKALFLYSQGKSDIEIAEKLGIHRNTVWMWRNRDEIFKDYLYEIFDDNLNRDRHNDEKYLSSARDVMYQAVTSENPSPELLEQAKIASLFIDKIHQNTERLYLMRKARQRDKSMKKENNQE